MWLYVDLQIGFPFQKVAKALILWRGFQTSAYLFGAEHYLQALSHQKNFERADNNLADKKKTFTF